jgi:Tfp pilus assembly protein PilF
MSYLESGIKHFTEGNIKEAEHFFSKAIQEDKTNIEAWFFRGKVNRMKGDLIAALNDFHKTVDLDPNHCEAKVSIELINNIIGFRNPDLLNH